MGKGCFNVRCFLFPPRVLCSLSWPRTSMSLKTTLNSCLFILATPYQVYTELWVKPKAIASWASILLTESHPQCFSFMLISFKCIVWGLWDGSMDEGTCCQDNPSSILCIHVVEWDMNSCKFFSISICAPWHTHTFLKCKRIKHTFYINFITQVMLTCNCDSSLFNIFSHCFQILIYFTFDCIIF